MRNLMVFLAFVSGVAFAAPSIVSVSSGGAPFGATDFTISVGSVSAGDVLIVATTFRKDVEGVNGCASGFPSGWNTLVNSNFSLGNLCVKYKVADGSEGDLTLYKPSDIAGMAWAFYKVSGSSGAVEGVYTATGNPPSLNPSWGVEDTLYLAIAYGKATAAPSGYALDVSKASGGVYGASLSAASKAVNADSEDPGAFTPNMSVSATVAIRP